MVMQSITSEGTGAITIEADSDGDGAGGLTVPTSKAPMPSPACPHSAREQGGTAAYQGH